MATAEDFEVVCSKIDQEKEFLNSVSQDIWKRPEVQYKEVHAHAVLTSALRRCGFQVEKHYFMTTAFRAEYSSKKVGGPTIAVLLEYDALPIIGHACGHNLIAEAGLAASIAIKAAMDADADLTGKLVILGTPAEETGGGKLRLLELNAFDRLDATLMVHPSNFNNASPPILCINRCTVEYKGKEAHASAYPWHGRNALDAAVACYNNISLLRQQVKPSCRIHAIITKGGTAPNVIPAESCMEVHVRAPTKAELRDLQPRVETCITSAAAATGCDVFFRFDEANSYMNLMTNKVLSSLYQNYAERLGVDFGSRRGQDIVGSTDMGNVSHAVPSIHPFYAISCDQVNHTKGFTEVSGSSSAQEPTLIAAKAMALTALHVMRCEETLDEIKRQFQRDIFEDMEKS